MSARPVASVGASDGPAEPVCASPLGALLPEGRIRPGTAVSAGGDMPLLLALAAEASVGTVGWAAVGLPQMGALAAQAAGLELASGMRIDDPGRRWAQVLATVAEAVPVVLVGRLDPVPDRIARRLAAVLRRSGSVLLAADSWQGAEVRMKVVSAAWEGIGGGHGLLRGRRVRVSASGRGAAAVARYADMWLPGSDGQIAALPHADRPATSAGRATEPRSAAAARDTTTLTRHAEIRLPGTDRQTAALPGTDGQTATLPAGNGPTTTVGKATEPAASEAVAAGGAAHRGSPRSVRPRREPPVLRVVG